jgi:hypothetical protein
VGSNPVNWIDLKGLNIDHPYFPGTHSAPPIYEPNKWNDGDHYQYSNNCYSYAYNRPGQHDPYTKPQPGEFTPGSPWTSLDCDAIKNAAKKDGMKSPDRSGNCCTGYHRVYLVLSPGRDYHWYRQDTGGNWSHKPGWGQATNLDASGNVIPTPLTANRDYSASGGPNYSIDCGTLCSPD